MLFYPQKKIATPRLTLRPWRMSDYRDFIAFTSDRDVMPSSGTKPAENEREGKRAFNTAMRDDGCYAIILNASNRAIGKIKFQTDFRRYEVNSLSIGYELAKEYWGRGYMTEALRGMIKEAFERRHVDILAISRFTVNERSKRVIEKCGFRSEGTMRRAFCRYDGKVFDDEFYSILKEEYFADKSKYLGEI